MERVTFENYASFAAAEFRKDVSFGRSVFHAGTTFQKGLFLGKARFDGTVFGGTAHWTWVRFDEDVSFRRATFAGQLPGRCGAQDERDGVANFALTRFRHPADCAGVKYWPDTLRQWWIYHLRHLLWRQKVSGIRSVAIGWFRKRLAAVYWKLRDLVWRGKPSGNLRVTVTYEPRWLARRLRPYSRYPSGLPGLGTRFVLDTQNIDGQSNPIFRRYVADQQFVCSFCESHRIWGRAWRWTCDYGRSTWRWVILSLTILLGCGWAYSPQSDWLLAPLRLDPVVSLKAATGSDGGCLTPYYFSVVTFTTLGFGDIVPLNTAGQVWVISEVLSGYLMLGLLLSVFSNRLLRRS
ncbi:potassium channel family protein [Candidatus Poribacteria bacterium]|nr:potassium channel family protein [Candidatus Poribacteria bacterium]